MAINLPCQWKDGFVMDPTKKQRVGYLCNLNGLGLAATLAQDLSVFCPYNNAAAPTYTTDLKYVSTASPATITCVAVLDNFTWGGGVGDAISISCYMSQENATTLKALKQTTLRTTSISRISWWVANFDEVTKEWFEECYPLSAGYATGMLNAPSKADIRLHIADEPVKVAPNIDINVYNVYLEIIPAANATYAFQVASSPTKKVSLPWGLVVGGLPLSSLPA